MTTKEVTAIAIKFLAIWYLFQVIIYAPVVIAMMNTLVGYQEEGMFQIQYLILIAVFIAVGVLTAKGLFKLSNSVLASCNDDNTANIGDDSKEFIVQVGGAFFIVYSLGNVPPIIATFDTSSLSSLAGTLFQLFVGMCLVLKPSKFVNKLGQFRA